MWAVRNARIKPLSQPVKPQQTSSALRKQWDGTLDGRQPLLLLLVITIGPL